MEDFLLRFCSIGNQTSLFTVYKTGYEIGKNGILTLMSGRLAVNLIIFPGSRDGGLDYPLMGFF